jgi:hypothetical protein
MLRFAVVAVVLLTLTVGLHFVMLFVVAAAATAVLLTSKAFRFPPNNVDDTNITVNVEAAKNLFIRYVLLSAIYN